MSCPAAAPAVSAPSARPRRSVNQRVATTAPSTSAVRPAPMPTITPHSSVSCQTWRIHSDSARPAPIMTTAPIMTRLRPMRSIRLAAKGAISP
jgi:hypothetical protein